MGKLAGSALMSIIVGALVLFVLFHLILTLPIWLLVGGIALAYWLRKSERRNRYLGQGREYRRRLGARSRW